jgi:hypothetical protein
MWGIQMPEAARMIGGAVGVLRLCWLARSSGMVAEMVFPECSRFEST